MNEIREDTIPFIRPDELEGAEPASSNIAEKLGPLGAELDEIIDQARAKELELKQRLTKMRLEEQVKGKKYELPDGSVVEIVRFKPLRLEDMQIEVKDEKTKALKLIPASMFEGKLLKEQKAA